MKRKAKRRSRPVKFRTFMAQKCAEVRAAIIMTQDLSLLDGNMRAVSGVPWPSGFRFSKSVEDSKLELLASRIAVDLYRNRGRGMGTAIILKHLRKAC